MPIFGRKPEECFNEFRDHLAELLAAIISVSHVFNYVGSGNRRSLGFLRGNLTTVPVETSHGVLHLYLDQTLEAERDGREYRLRTVEYRYRLFPQLGPKQQALVRWEFSGGISPWERKHCRTHMHIDAKLLNMDLDKLHLPTGWITIEEVLRFLIEDLGMKPPCGDSWARRLAESERAFYERFVSRRYPKDPAAKHRS